MQGVQGCIYEMIRLVACVLYNVKTVKHVCIRTHSLGSFYHDTKDMAKKKKNVKKNGGNDDDEWRQAFANMIRNLHTNFAPEKGLTLEKRLWFLNRAIERFHSNWQCSFQLIKAEIKKSGICLADCRVHGSARALKKAFRTRQARTIPLKLAKRHKYVKMALVTLAN